MNIAVQFRDIRDMTLNEIKLEMEHLRNENNKKNTLYGYDVEYLIAFSMELKNNNISMEDLKSFSEAYKKGYEQAFEIVKNIQTNYIKNMLNGVITNGTTN